MTDRFLPGVPGAEIERIFNAAAGNEIASGKFDSPESSAALAANAFGFFLNRPRDLPPLPDCGRGGMACPFAVARSDGSLPMERRTPSRAGLSGGNAVGTHRYRVQTVRAVPWQKVSFLFRCLLASGLGG